jgi:hypothetical protein
MTTRSQKMLSQKEKAKKIAEKMLITYRQPKNLKKIVTGLPSEGEGEVEIDPGCYKCGSLGSGLKASNASSSCLWLTMEWLWVARSSWLWVA